MSDKETPSWPPVLGEIPGIPETLKAQLKTPAQIKAEAARLASTEPAPNGDKDGQTPSEDGDLYTKLSSHTKGSIAQAGVPLEMGEVVVDIKPEENTAEGSGAGIEPGDEPAPENQGNSFAEESPTSTRPLTNVSLASLHRGLKEMKRK